MKNLKHIQSLHSRSISALGGNAIAQGNIAMPFNTEGMYRAWIKPDGSRGGAIFRDGAAK